MDIYIYICNAMDINVCMYVCGLGFSVFIKIRIIQYLMFCNVCFSNKSIVMGGAYYAQCFKGRSEKVGEDKLANFCKTTLR